MRDRKEWYKRAKEKEDQLNQEFQNSAKPSAKDVFAMLVSAFLVFVPITLAILVAISLFVLWLFRAF